MEKKSNSVKPETSSGQAQVKAKFWEIIETTTSQPKLITVPIKGAIQPSGNFFLALNRSHHFLFKKVRI